MDNTEGFVAFQKEKSPLDKVWIPQYSKNEQVHKLNDNMFFDSRNGNLIELDAEEYSPTANTPTTGGNQSTAITNTPTIGGNQSTAMTNTAIPPVTSSNQSGAMNNEPSTDATQPYAKDTAMIITTAGVETAVRTAVATAAPYIKEFSEKRMAQDMRVNVGGPNVQGSQSANETAALVTPTSAIAPGAGATPATAVTGSGVTTAATSSGVTTAATSSDATAADAKTPADAKAVQAVLDAAKAATADSSVKIDGLTNMVDTTGVTITRVIISPRNGQSSTIYDIKPADIAPRDTNESKNTTVSSSYKSWKYESQCANTSKKTVFYIPWKENTYIIIVDKTDNNPYSLYMFGANNEVGHKTFSKQDISDIYSQTLLDEKTNSAITEPLYNNQSVYKISKNVAYDIQRGNTVILPSGQGEQVSVHNRDGVKVDLSVIKPDEKGAISSLSFSPWIIKISGKTAGFCMPYKDTTVICILSDTGNPALMNVKRFTAAGVDVEGVQQSAEKPTTDVSESSDYILKTQIVPPVCPTCPACPDNVTCTNCGGQGGSGTLTTDGKSIVGGNQAPETNGNRQGGLVRQAISDTTGLARDVVSGTDDLVRDAASGTAGLAKDAVGGTVGLAKDAVGGTVGLAKDAVGGTVGLAKDVVGGTVGLAKDTVSGATGLLTGAVSGVAGLFKPNPTQLYNNQPQFQNNAINNTMQSASGRRGGSYGGQTIDNTTYYGALPDRPSANYMPITADFSAFSR